MRDLFFAWLAVLWAAGTVQAQVRFHGQILTENQAPIPGARVQLESGNATAAQTTSDIRGEFSLNLAQSGDYFVTVEREGFFPIRRQAVAITAGADPATFALVPVRELQQSLDIVASPLALDLDATSSKQAVTGTEIINIPYPNTNDLRSALRIVPGVIRDNRGGLHMHGGAEEQVLYTLNGFNLTDPLTGRFETRLSVESVQSLEVNTGNLSAEHGKGSAGTLAIRAHTGDDKLRYSATNFVPGVENQKGWTIADWTPRANVSGPIRRGQAWFSNSVDTVFTKTVVRDLPQGEDRYTSWRFSNLINTQINLKPSNILHAGFLFHRWTAGQTGLSALDPIETSVDRRSRQWFFHVKDQAYLRSRAVLELGYAANRTFGREIPQGEGILSVTPEGRRGFHFVDAVRTSSRDQFLIHAFLPSFTRMGNHQLKTGFDLNNLTYWQDVRRTGFENFDEEGHKVRRVTFGGTGLVRRANTEAAVYVQDGWRVRPSLLLEIGLRSDWDKVVSRWDWAPRAGFSWSPAKSESLKIYGGFAKVFDATNLRVFTRPQDQYSLTTYFSPDGALSRGPALALFSADQDRLLRPRFHNWTAGAEKHWSGAFSMRVEILRRRGARGFSYQNINDNQDYFAPWLLAYNARQLDAIYQLTNYRADKYDSVSVSVRHVIRRQYEWTASYTRSRAVSNTVVDITVEDPIVTTNNAGRMPWDSPHRFITWGYLPTPFKNWSVAYLAEARTGFPFSAKLDTGYITGNVNAFRFPNFFEANLHLERRFNFRNHRFAFRFGSNNLTNRRNPDTVNNFISSSRYLQYYGGVGRSTNFRIRWLGRL